MCEWTSETVAARFSEAVETARRLPPVRVQGYFSTWPAFIREGWERYSIEGRGYRPIAPCPEAIDRMLETMRWMQILDVESRHIVWMRASHYEWSQIAKRFGCAARTVQRRRNIALSIIAEKLNGMSVVSASYKAVRNHADN